eukprot:1388448-Amorphochlora_amoeboformis.AAC.1
MKYNVRVLRYFDGLELKSYIDEGLSGEVVSGIGSERHAGRDSCGQSVGCSRQVAAIWKECILGQIRPTIDPVVKVYTLRYRGTHRFGRLSTLPEVIGPESALVCRGCEKAVRRRSIRRGK